MDTTDSKRDDLPPLEPKEAARRRSAFFKAGGHSLQLLMQFAETLPETGVTIKDAKGYIYFKNRRALGEPTGSDMVTTVNYHSSGSL